MHDPSIPSRKKQHVDLAVSADVGFRARTTGLDQVEIEYNALPEIDASDITTTTTVLGKQLQLPFLISAMTGGYAEATSINAMLAEAAQHLGIGMSVGSMRAVIERPQAASTYCSILQTRPPLVIANVGAAQLAAWHREGTALDMVQRLADVIEADAVGIHLNPLQELIQPEGEPRFRGVLNAIADVVARFDRPVVVKEVGAGISGAVAGRLLDAGVRCIDVAGAGGTSWAGIEILRSDDAEAVDHLWDVGIPTADCLRQCRFPCESHGATMIASGGIVNGTQTAVAIALGAHAVGTARPVLRELMATQRVDSVVTFLQGWERTLRQWMFLSGSATIAHLRSARVR
ncbi:MAG: type 2 isopentenyl-diphosphate Delta-isomerase [Candidatus Kapabacteria bacterium]|nr:type 2 isopentenyl-diphosphate Delta-isomerase [Candidatus Kapabacteria bacterium]